MNDPIGSIARSLSADVRELGTLSQNVANLTTPGYRAVHTAPGFLAGVDGSGRVDTKDGALMHTGRPLDVALQGSGYFQVQVGDQVFLTRSGQFQRDANGALVDAGGHQVLGVDGPLMVDSDDITIGEDGSLMSGKETVGQLSIVDVASADALSPVGSGLYAASGDTAEGTAHVFQGALEGSNVDPGHEMVRLMEISRHAGSVQHAISAYHTAVLAGIDEIGKDT